MPNAIKSVLNRLFHPLTNLVWILLNSALDGTRIPRAVRTCEVGARRVQEKRVAAHEIVPAQYNFVPAQYNFVPAQYNFVPAPVQFRTCTARTRTVLEFRDREQVRRHVRVTRGSTLPAHAYPFVASPEAPRRYAAAAVPPAKVRRYPRSRYRSRFRLVSGTRYGYAVRFRRGHAIRLYNW